MLLLRVVLFLLKGFEAGWLVLRLELVRRRLQLVVKFLRDDELSFIVSLPLELLLQLEAARPLTKPRSALLHLLIVHIIFIKAWILVELNPGALRLLRRLRLIRLEVLAWLLDFPHGLLLLLWLHL